MGITEALAAVLVLALIALAAHGCAVAKGVARQGHAAGAVGLPARLEERVRLLRGRCAQVVPIEEPHLHLVLDCLRLLVIALIASPDERLEAGTHGTLLENRAAFGEARALWRPPRLQLRLNVLGGAVGAEAMAVAAA